MSTSTTQTEQASMDAVAVQLLDDLTDALTRAIAIAHELGWDTDTGEWREHGISNMYNGPYELPLISAGWELLESVGWGGSGANLELARRHADELKAVTRLAKEAL